MSDGRGGTGVKAAVTMAAKHPRHVVFFEDVCLHGFLLWHGEGGIFERVFEM